MDWFTNLRMWEIDLIISVQNKFSKFEEVLEGFSHFLGPTYIYLFLLPCMAAINTRLYHKALISCIISDFMNMMLKWIINEARPFWWVHETEVYTSLTRPTLYQTEATCETSPGSPSGHMMMISSYLFISLIAIEKYIVHNYLKLRRPLRYLARLVFALILVIMGISRMYIAAHFFHQCLFGALLGMCVSEAVSFTRFVDTIETYGKIQWLKVGCFLTLTVTSIFWLIKYFSGNPMESVHMAFKYCGSPLYPKPETTVMFSTMRNIAQIIGFMFASPMGDSNRKLNRPQSFLFCAVLIFLHVHLIDYTPKNYKLYVFYTYSFFVYAVFQYIYLIYIPKWSSKDENNQDKNFAQNPVQNTAEESSTSSSSEEDESEQDNEELERNKPKMN